MPVRVMMKRVFVLSVVLEVCVNGTLLYPRPSATRELISLDGLWQFSFMNQSIVGAEPRNDRDVHVMPVPSSYNDILTSFEGREYVGKVKYERTFWVPNSWRNGRRVWIRFGSVSYAAEVYINGVLATSHQIGHLPFSADITAFLNNNPNTVTVFVDNTLSETTIPQGTLETLVSGRVKQEYTFDFFNYAGIDRSVFLFTTPATYIDDVTVDTDINGTTGIINFVIQINGTEAKEYRLVVLDKLGNTFEETIKMVTGSTILEDCIKIPNAKLWWPYLMSQDPGYLYTMKIEVYGKDDLLLDTYEQKVGIRKLTWDDKSFKINGRNLYIRGFAKHEDSDIRGRGLDLPLVVRDHNLLKWMGANAYRTSHYPYAEEIMDMADEMGFMIIDEVPAVDINNFTNAALKENHKRSLAEMIRRDKNRPSVILWSLGNSPYSEYEEATAYYKELVAYIKDILDKTRPVTIPNKRKWNIDHSAADVDIISFNRYEAWYDHSGDLDVIKPMLIEEAKGWHNKYNKPVLITEYGADTMPGFHSLPASIWSEDYQNAAFSENFVAMDELRKNEWFIGEMVWNFADCQTQQNYMRVNGNRKGVFTRQRQPKATAHLLRRRYWSLAKEIDNATIPTNLDNYVASNGIKDEL